MSNYKKIALCVILFLFSLSVISFMNIDVNAEDKYHLILENAVTNDEKGKIFEDDKIVLINGTNFFDMESIDFAEKKYFIYNFEISEKIEKNKFNAANIILYDYSNVIPSSIMISLSSIDVVNMKDKICEYFDFIISLSHENEYVTYSRNSAENGFEKIWNSRYIHEYKPYGYIIVTVDIFKYFNTEDNSLYVASMNADFTPGITASYNGIDGYEDYRITSGYFHVEAMQAVEDLGPGQKRLGGIPYYKDSFPSSSSGVVTITSSVDRSFTFGYSYSNGFSTSSGFTVEEGKTYGESILFGYSKSLTISDPIVSSQLSPTNTNKIQWNFEMVSEETKKITFPLDCGYIFDMDESNSQTYPDAITIRTDFRMDFLNLSNDKKTITGFDSFSFP